DSQGRTVNFKNTIIIMTSNIGARLITDKKKALGFGQSEESEKQYSEIKDDVMAELKREFRPEFLNRVDDIIVFHKLTHDDICEIAERMLESLKKRLAELKIDISFDRTAIEKVADSGFDPLYGARPLRRAIQSNIEDALSEKMLNNSIKSGENVVCKVEDGVYTFEKH
ncbi:MAG: AAA family ATPase, partial [Oscillospiraceae bacterium]|nr:AAA family ATPase [Oscillospiraceae bacterium]